MLRRTKATLRAALFATLVFSGSTWGEVPSDLPELPDSPIVRVVVPDEGVGSGVVIKQEKFPDKGCKETVLTAAHVVSMAWMTDKTTYWPAVIVQTPNNGFSGMVVAYDLTADLALLEVWSQGCLAEAALVTSDTYVTHGAPVWAGGWLFGEELTLIPGAVGHYRADGWYEEMAGPYMALSTPVKPGMSGGAVMWEGELVALVSGRSPRAEFYAIAVPMWRIQEFLDSYAEVKDS